MTHFTAMKLICAVLLAFVGVALAKSYDGYVALRTNPVPAFTMPALKMLEDNLDFNFMTTPRVDQPVVIMAGPEHIDLLRDALHRLRLNPTVQIADVGEHVRREREEIEAIRRTEQRSSKAAVYNRYMDNDEIMAFIHETVAANPSIASILDVATSSEGRPVHGIKISSGSGRRSVFIDCIIHAREWLAAPVCMKTIEDVIADPQLQALVDWYILPIANPDGYVWSWDVDRFWRKTRRPNAGSNCVGTDPNRNFDMLWNNDNNNLKCSETYPGDRVFSEPECAGMGALIQSMGDSGQLVLYIAVHAYGPYLLYPHGWTDVPAPNDADLASAANTAADIIRSYRGIRYVVGPAGSTLYYTYGASDDFAYSTAGVPFAYTFELPGGGFDPPASEIQPTVTETVPAIISLVNDALALAP